MGTFAEALEDHLDAIRARDIEALRTTVAPEGVTLVSANGEVSTESDHFLELHRDWFRSETWQIETTILSAHEGSDLAVCTMELSYLDKPAGRDVIEVSSVLTLAFQKIGERWLLVFDQNTPRRG